MSVRNRKGFAPTRAREPGDWLDANQPQPGSETITGLRYFGQGTLGCERQSEAPAAHD